FAVTGPVAGGTVPSRTVTFTGTGTPASTVRVLTANGAQVPGTAPAAVGADGVWTTTGTFAANAPATEHLSLQQTTGGSADGSVALVVQLPATPSLRFAVTGPVAGGTVPSRTVTFTGTGTPASTVRVLTANGAQVPGTAPAAVGADGVWTTTGTFAANAPVTEHLSLQQTTGGSADGTVALVVQLPAVSSPFALTTPAAGATVPSRTVTFTGTGTPASTVRVRTANGVQVPGTGGAIVGSDHSWTTTGTFLGSAPATEHLSVQQTTGGSANGTVSVAIQLPGGATPLATGPALTLGISAAQSSFGGAGQSISYQYVVKNTGNVTLSAIGLTDSKVTAADLHCPTSSLAPTA